MTYEELLKDFETIVKNEAQYEKDRVIIQRRYNFETALKNMNAEMEEYPVIKERFQRNYEKAKNIVNSLSIVHNTFPENVISILKNKKIMCSDELKSIGYPYRKRVSIEYLKKNLNAHVYGVVGPGEKLFGPAEIVFTREADQIEGAFFIYRNHFMYTVSSFFKAQMDIKNWREYLARKIASDMEDPTGYTDKIPIHERVEFYFPRDIDTSYISKIVCSQRSYYDDIILKIENEFGSDSKLKDLVVLEEKNIR